MHDPVHDAVLEIAARLMRADGLSETDAHEAMLAAGLPGPEREAALAAWEGRFQASPSTGRTERLDRSGVGPGDVRRGQWRGVPSTRDGSSVERAAPRFRRTDDRRALGDHARLVEELRAIWRAARPGPSPSSGQRARRRSRRGAWGTGGTYHAG